MMIRPGHIQECEDQVIPNEEYLLQVRVNLPNGDMVGHTGDLDATVIGCSVADKCVQVFSSLSRLGHCLFLSTT